MILFLLLFVGIPLFELYWLIEVGSYLGAIPTIFLTVFTAVLGGMLVRMQGLATAMQVQKSMAVGEMPAIEMLEGLLLLACGFFLLLPGFFTDIIGFLVLVPGIRRWLVVAFLKRAQILHSPDSSGGSGGDQPRIIEGEYHRDDD
ncbi:MAG: FxsA family protein [Gammaproteobacteria bacterium]|nr:FxsA family protein [Gammaproteobacteria bacterium]